jgi:hypothetical protein
MIPMCRVLNRSNREPVPAIVVVGRIHFRTIEVQVPSIRLGVVCRTPVVAVRAPIVQSRTIVVATGREEYTHSAVATYNDVSGWSGACQAASNLFFFLRRCRKTCDL